MEALNPGWFVPFSPPPFFFPGTAIKKCITQHFEISQTSSLQYKQLILLNLKQI